MFLFLFISILCFLLQAILACRIEALDKYFSSRDMQEPFFTSIITPLAGPNLHNKVFCQLYPLASSSEVYTRQSPG